MAILQKRHSHEGLVQPHGLGQGPKVVISSDQEERGTRSLWLHRNEVPCIGVGGDSGNNCRHGCGRRIGEEFRHLDPFAKSVLNFGEKGHRFQRMPTQVEEVAVGSYCIRPKNLFPDFDNGLLVPVSGWHIVIQRIGFAVFRLCRQVWPRRYSDASNSRIWLAGNRCQDPLVTVQKVFAGLNPEYVRVHIQRSPPPILSFHEEKVQVNKGARCLGWDWRQCNTGPPPWPDEIPLEDEIHLKRWMAGGAFGRPDGSNQAFKWKLLEIESL